MAQATHEVFNQYAELADYDLLATDAALQEALQRAGAAHALPALGDYARRLGSAGTHALAELANRHTPILHRFDSRGRRADRVEFHPAWDALMALYRGEGLVSMPFDSDRPGRWSAWAAGFYLHGQVEQGTLCPATMTQAAIPLLRKEPALWARLGDRLHSRTHDPREAPAHEKAGIWLGMGMTEKQGGSDVRANTTVATPLGAGGRGGEYRLRGHKWFFSTPQSDAHLVVARTGEGGPFACFYVPRRLQDGTLNGVHVQRLKDKVGNRSNASAEVEFHDAWGVLMGEEGRGIPTIIEMATYTRLNCVAGSAAILRQATVQAIAYARRRHAFGKALAEQPLMRTVLADLALESEAALALLMRLAEAFERDADGTATPADRAWKRVMTPAAKFWVCKRGVEMAGEAMEVFGGNGYVQEGVMARLFLEAPVNSIWEGSGNVMCLDVLRALARDTEAAHALLEEFAPAAQGEPRIGATLRELQALLALPPQELEGMGRLAAQRLVLAAQACLLRRHAPAAVADAFIATRLGDAGGGRVAGAIDARAIAVDAILQRACPA
ncbi:acyl-CoA dehydrogenase family protein [Paracidovorax citrulli]|uniref:Acyl-CoA dehydrogenase domain protein n=2 Tax=Paracidovorax citrulli TaxID=80869 RepID=A1TIG8_PARC0|nr:acyl-CoA dehydrogenase family protein [Paracidovorax citrulli]ABM30756.1 acyl-CoA dehydrogenase domain protein [Paracidovorax citrulli AAC00-1]ATG96056.1 DNA alkylation response protein [Paracidovorax citrulli]PVY64928.1 putative acyl-CoA dehydrogenase [Paracidovorax citrulli]QCX10830.1 Putative acyl-CoA dehydrogenase AidB [Paracidovorax citrulli]REG70879.1 putative acyl-CoA dehydrogenase [Paracidovorax citrulli]